MYTLKKEHTEKGTCVRVCMSVCACVCGENPLHNVNKIPPTQQMMYYISQNEQPRRRLSNVITNFSTPRAKYRQEPQSRVERHREGTCRQSTVGPQI